MKEVKTTSRYGDERIFIEVNENTWSVHFGDMHHVSCSRNDDGSLYSFDPSGGPFISLKTNLKTNVSHYLPDREIESIEWNKQGFYIIHFKD